MRWHLIVWMKNPVDTRGIPVTWAGYDVAIYPIPDARPATQDADAGAGARGEGAGASAYNPMDDETNLYDLEAWSATLVTEILRYTRESAGMNEWHRSRHTFKEWMAAFGRYMSW
jgi:hypothetical protein